MKIYENQVIILPLGFKIHKDQHNHHFRIYMEDNTIKLAVRRKSVKIGNAIRVRNIKENTRFKNCTIFFEGTLTEDTIIPFGIHKAFIYKK